MNSLRSNSISYFVAWLKPRLNIDSENPTSSKDLLVRNVFELFLEVSPFSRGGDSRDVKTMARPEGAQALRAIPKL